MYEEGIYHPNLNMGKQIAENNWSMGMKQSVNPISNSDIDYILVDDQIKNGCCRYI